MPKPLRLKKVKSDQMPITQFFKNTGPESRNFGSAQSANNLSSTLKRKAVPAVQDDEVQIVDEYILTVEDSKSTEKHRKKQKTEQLSAGASKCHKEAKKFLLKENGVLCDKSKDAKENRVIHNIKDNSSQTLDQNEKSGHNCGILNIVQVPEVELVDIENISSYQKQSQNKSPLKDCNEKSCSPIKLSFTSKEETLSANTEPRRSPRIAKLQTPEKGTRLSTKTSARIALDFDQNIDVFKDEWDRAVDEKNHEENIVNKTSSTSNSPGIDTYNVCENQVAENILNKMTSNVKSPVKDTDNLTANHATEKQLLTPKKTPLVNSELRRSPRVAKQKSPDKLAQSLKTAKVALDFTQNIEDMFGDEWEPDCISEKCKEDLDLSVLQRCEVISVEHEATHFILGLKNSENHSSTCNIEGIWRDTPLSIGEVVSVMAGRNASGRYAVTNTAGVLVLRPDHLMSTTSVVAGVFCRRKAVLQERFKGIDAGNHAMTIGILVHELVQTALLNRVTEPARLRQETDKLIKLSAKMLYDSGLTVEATRASMEVYIAPLAEFMLNYVSDRPPKLTAKHQWQGHIDEILDIEENVCCPQLGLKGKIDATVQVTIHDRKERAVVPLELKSGRASGSAEHRGQIVLYNMMMSVQQDLRLATNQQSGLLLYLKEKSDLREVTSGHPERRDLLMLRNQLVQYLADGPDASDPEKLADIEEASHQLRQRLPEPVHHENACTKCPYLTLCSLHLWHTEGPRVSDSHPLVKLRSQALGHLSLDHVTYLLHWSALLRAEERGQGAVAPLTALWTDSPEARCKRGTCAANLTLKCVQASNDRFLHVFQRGASKGRGDNESLDQKLEQRGPQEGEFSIVSIKGRPWIAAGVISLVNGPELHIMLERDLSRRLSKSTQFHIDQYQSYATTVQNLTNLGVLMEDSDRADRLRKLIIDKQLPAFETKLPREVGRFGAKMMKSLNVQQQRAVLKAVAAKDYFLLQGLPGTGKTQTISVMIQMLAALRLRVLVTAHTHSAVDTVLTRLPPSLRIMRLGSGARVVPSLQNRCETALTAHCSTPEELQHVYDSMEVVGVTCLGAQHAMLARTVFDVCIVDEATQVLQCTVLRPLLTANRFVLVGDPDQLPPVVRSRAARRLGMEWSLFHRLQTEAATCALRLQYRMNRRLLSLANDVSYRGLLQCASDQVAEARLQVDFSRISESYGASSWVSAACSPDMDRAALFVDVGVRPDAAARSRSCVNATEACVVLALVDALRLGGVEAASIGVISPYREQVSLLRRGLSCAPAPPPEVSTVDQFQGRDKCVILYSCTRSDEDDVAAKEGEILNDQRRVAVSVTRAKHKFIAVGHARALNRYAPIQRMIRACLPLPLPACDRDAVLQKYGHFVS